MTANIWLWIGFNAFVLIMLALDLGVFHRKAHVVTFKESIAWTESLQTVRIISGKLSSHDQCRRKNPGIPPISRDDHHDHSLRRGAGRHRDEPRHGSGARHFAAAHNLEALTPRWLQFAVLTPWASLFGLAFSPISLGCLS